MPHPTLALPAPNILLSFRMSASHEKNYFRARVRAFHCCCFSGCVGRCACACRYAQAHGGYVVTNDMYRDHVQSVKGDPKERERQRGWTKTHLISYTFVQDEFLPNPNFSFQGAD